jgi:hypothetical protein
MTDGTAGQDPPASAEGAPTSPGLEIAADPKARAVFHQVLLAHLGGHGASSITRLRRDDIKYFRTSFAEPEIECIVESARRHGLVEPLDQPKDAHGIPICEPEWTPVERGKSFRRPRGLAIRDAAGDLGQAFDRSKAAYAAIGGGVAVVGTGLLHDANKYLVALPAAVVVALATLMIVGLQRDTALRHAAKAWPRLRTHDERFFAWQTGTKRLWVRAVAVLMYLAYFAGVVVARTVYDWTGNLPIYLSGPVVALCIGLWISQARPPPIPEHERSR